MSDHILFHPYEPLLVFGNAKTGNLCTWDTDRMTQAAFWPSGTAHGAQLSSMQLVNEHDVALLATASSDGVVRLWRDFATPEPRLLTGWRAVAKPRREGAPPIGAGRYRSKQPHKTQKQAVCYSVVLRTRMAPSWARAYPPS